MGDSRSRGLSGGTAPDTFSHLLAEKPEQGNFADQITRADQDNLSQFRLASMPQRGLLAEVGDKTAHVAAGVFGGSLTAGGKGLMDSVIFHEFNYPNGNSVLRLDSHTRELSARPGASNTINAWVEHHSPAAQAYREASAQRPWARAFMKEYREAQWAVTDSTRAITHSYNNVRELLRGANMAVAETPEAFAKYIIDTELTSGKAVSRLDIKMLETARDAMAKEASMADDALRVQSIYKTLNDPTSAAFRSSLGRHAAMGALVAGGVIALDYGAHKTAQNYFGEDSAVARALRPNIVGTGLAASAFTAPIDWRTRTIMGGAGWALGKGLNIASDYMFSEGAFADTQLKPELSMKYSMKR